MGQKKDSEHTSNFVSRKDFLSKTAVAAAGFTFLPSALVSGIGRKPPSDKLNIACVGVGGRGSGVIGQIDKTENIVALCDVDWRYAKEEFKRYPDARKFWDWRVMLDEMGDDIDAVVVATADHTHAVIAAHAMTMGKHVYVEKPLTHTVYESRLLTALADKYGVATQMGDQGASGEGINQIIEWVQSGLIGDVTKIESFTNRPIWLQGQNPPTEVQPVPDTLNWDLFVGPAEMRPYNEIYTPWNFRGWWDFGTGALGDMACHILHAPYKALELGYPTKVQGSSTLLLKESAPTAQKVRLTYPERRSRYGGILPEVDVHWTDGGIEPVKPDGWPAGRNMNHRGGAVLFHGSRDTLVCGCYGSDPWLLSGNEPNVPKTERRVQVGKSTGESAHVLDWARACKESPGSRVKTKSSFDQSGPFNEMVVMGVLAVRLQELNKELIWDGENMMFTNISNTEELTIVERDEFQMVNGNPSFSQQRTDPINALEFANGLIRKNYREGWTLPDMPSS